MKINTMLLLSKAADLMSEDLPDSVHVGTYTDREYDRAIVELTTGLMGLGEEYYDGIYRMLRVIKTP